MGARIILSRGAETDSSLSCLLCEQLAPKINTARHIPKGIYPTLDGWTALGEVHDRE